ncbi:MAG: AAA family ATPase [Thermoleophilia bacterium]
MEAPHVVGRDAELARLDRFLRSLRDGPGLLMLEGEPGIGKTTLWSWACDTAAVLGMAVWGCRGAPTEVRMGYAGLADLLAGVPPAALERLPDPQRQALEVAPLRRGASPGNARDPRAVSTACMSLIDDTAGERPVLLAVDDLQWVDASTVAVLRFIARRMAGRVGMLLTRRDAPQDGVVDVAPGVAVPHQLLRLTPLDEVEIGRLVRQRGDRRVTAPALAGIRRLANGNPFYALELARALPDDGRFRHGELPRSLVSLAEDRFAALPEDVRDVLLLVAAHRRPTVAAIRAALGGDAAPLIEAAERAGMLVVEGGRLRFAHPVLAGAVYAVSGPRPGGPRTDGSPPSPTIRRNAPCIWHGPRWHSMYGHAAAAGRRGHLGPGARRTGRCRRAARTGSGRRGTGTGAAGASRRLSRRRR